MTLTADTTPPPAAKPLDSDLTRPSVTAITSVPVFTGNVLDKDKANWVEWKDAMYMSMELAGLWRYTGEDNIVNVQPDVATEPRAAANWSDNDRKACAYITSALALGERRAITPLRSDAKAYWTTLKMRHEKDGAAAQIYLIRDALSLIAHTGDNVPKTLDQAWLLGDRIYAMGDISAHIFKVILALNVLSEHEELLFPVLDILKRAPSTDKVDILEIRSVIEDRFRVMEKNKGTGTASSTALVAHAAGRTPLICTNCKGQHHTAEYCIKAGGGMAGKTVAESQAQRRMDRDAKKPRGSKPGPPPAPNSDKIPGKVKVMGTDAHGRAFALYLDESAIPASGAPSAPSIGTGAFAGLESISADELSATYADPEYDVGYMASFVDDAPPSEARGGDANLPSWLENAGDLFARVDWAKYSSPDIGSAFTAGVTDPIPLSQLPFHPDSGATTHISPDHNDFTVLRPINSRAIRGVNGSVIYATGVGDITIRVTSEDDANSFSTITLKDALYIPRSVRHLRT